MPLAANVLDMQWIVRQSETYLVILGNNGTQYLFPYVPSSDAVLGPTVEAYNLDAHPLIDEPYRRGILSCHEGFILSTTGDELVGQRVDSGQNLCNSFSPSFLTALLTPFLSSTRPCKHNLAFK